MRAILFQKFNFNYIYFILYLFSCIITTYIESTIGGEEKKEIEDNDKNQDIDKGQLINVINLFIVSISDFLAIILYCVKRRLSGEENISRSLTKSDDDTKPDRSYSNYIYNNAFEDEIIKRTKYMNINTMLVGIFEFLSDTIYFLYFVFFSFEKNANFYLLNCTVIFQILLQYFLSRIILKAYFYKHHYLSIFINIASFIILFILDVVNSGIAASFIAIYALSLICLTLANAYGKKAMIFGYISPFSLLIYKGIYKLFLLIIFSIIFLPIMGAIRNNFFSDHEEIKGEMILIFILNFIFSFLKNLFNWILIDRFSLNHLALTLILEDLSYGIIYVFDYDANNKDLKQGIDVWEITLRIFIYVILFIAAMIHNEIFIITKCGLGENTKLFLDEKVKEEMSLINDNDLKRNDTMIELDENNNKYYK